MDTTATTPIPTAPGQPAVFGAKSRLAQNSGPAWRCLVVHVASPQTFWVSVVAWARCVSGPWDARNRLTAVTDYNSSGQKTQEVHYDYDLHDRWIGEQVKTFAADGQTVNNVHRTRFIYDGNQIVLQFESNDASTPSTLTHRYLWGSGVDQLLSDQQITTSANGGTVTTTSTVVWTLADNLGTVRDLATSQNVTDATTGVTTFTTTVVNHRVYDSYGNLVSQVNPATRNALTVGCLFGFTGRPLDTATGQVNMLHRWYDSKIGQWLSADPTGYGAGDGNEYRYCYASPTNGTDPSGLRDPIAPPAAPAVPGSQNAPPKLQASPNAKAPTFMQGPQLQAWVAQFMTPGRPLGYSITAKFYTYSIVVSVRNGQLSPNQGTELLNSFQVDGNASHNIPTWVVRDLGQSSNGEWGFTVDAVKVMAPAPNAEWLKKYKAAFARPQAPTVAKPATGTETATATQTKEEAKQESRPFYRGRAADPTIELTDADRNQVRFINKGTSEELVNTTHGISVNFDKQWLISHGMAPIRQVVQLPPTLKVEQRGSNATHYEIMPRTPIPWAKYVAEVKKIVLGPVE